MTGVAGRYGPNACDCEDVVLPRHQYSRDMGILGWIVLGLIAGAIAKAILPGRQKGGWITTLLLGIVGALLGGFLGSALFNVTLGSFFEIRTWLLAIGGSLIVLLIWGLVTRGSRRAA